MRSRVERGLYSIIIEEIVNGLIISVAEFRFADIHRLGFGNSGF